ncbi:FAD-linked oxidase C-terminal domain-containing protein [uncultured Methylobacterium sp.]|uniref:FAD-linked oxidase C-terminal domain-containing protein n=1 Tax=uncultured Methylobacterium sp. TaxID=157278 RepID=UPI0035CC7C20
MTAPGRLTSPLRRDHALQGSVSAEHGIGLEKRGRLALSRSGAEIGVARGICTARLSGISA